MNIFEVVDTHSGKTVNSFTKRELAARKADEMNTFIYNAGQSPADSPIGFNAFPDRFKVKTRGASGARFAHDYCCSCGEEVHVKEINKEGICYNCLPQ